jgi:hypothetical protein
MESEEYRRLVDGASDGAGAGEDGGVRVLKAMRSRRS